MDASPEAGTMVRRYFQVLEGLRDADLVKLQHVLSPHVRVTFAGSSRFAGTYEGVGAVLALAGRTRSVFQGRGVRLDSARDREVRSIVTVWTTGPTGGGREFTLHHACRFDEELRASELDVHPEDPQGLDAFLEVG